MDLPLFMYLANCGLDLFVVMVLADIPNLKLTLSDMCFELRNVGFFWEASMIDLREDLDDLEFGEDLSFEFGVVFRDIACDVLDSFVVLEFIEHASE